MLNEDKNEFLLAVREYLELELDWKNTELNINWEDVEEYYEQGIDADETAKSIDNEYEKEDEEIDDIGEPYY